jgi:hypothetical protein
MKTERISPDDKAILKEKLIQQLLPAFGLLVIYGVFFYLSTWVCWSVNWITSSQFVLFMVIETVVIFGLIGFKLRKPYADYSSGVKFVSILNVTAKKVNHRDIVSENIYPNPLTGLAPERDELYLEFDHVKLEVTLDEFNTFEIGDQASLFVSYSSRTIFKITKPNPEVGFDKWN